MEFIETVLRILIWFTYFVSLYFVVFWLLVLFDKKPRAEKVMLKSFPVVTIVVPAYNEEKKIEATLNSVLGMDYPRKKLELMVVNDGSTDNTRNIVERIIKDNGDFNIRLINQKNRGKGAALNAGLREAKGDFFVCLDADSFVEKNALKVILPYFSKPDIACVLPILKVRAPDNLLRKMQWMEYIINIFYKELMGRLSCIHVAPGPFSVYRTEILKAVGYFDENFNLTEDLEMALRLQSRHYEIVQILDGGVSTVAPGSLKQLYMQRNRWYKGSIYNALRYRYMILNRDYGDFGIIQLPVIILSGVLAVIILSALLYYNLWVPFTDLIKLRYVNFDILTLIRNFSIDFNMLDLNFTSIFVAVTMLFVSVYIIMKSHRSAKERVSEHGLFPVVVYFVVYFLLLGIIWFGVIADVLLGRRQRW